jgi:hypothetical protein
MAGPVLRWLRGVSWRIDNPQPGLRRFHPPPFLYFLVRGSCLGLGVHFPLPWRFYASYHVPSETSSFPTL